MNSFIFSKAVWRAGLESLPCSFWSLGLTFDLPVLIKLVKWDDDND